MAIIVRLEGGLGNTLFQYAFARGVSARLKTTYLFDWAPFNQYFDMRPYMMDKFNAKMVFAKPWNCRGFVWIGRQYKIFDKLYRLLRLRRLMPFYFLEKTFAFDPDVFSKKDGTYFDGFWQTEKYFRHVQDEIRKELTLANSLSDYSKSMEDEILGTNAVSIHVRRADLVTNPVMTVFHGYCSPEYYDTAVAYIAKRVSNPHLFIFSDDYEWSAEYFKKFPYPVTCSKNGEQTNFEDIHLMSKCRHHIIANSSFGWWGAWLDPKKDKIVVAPKRWFANPKTNTEKNMRDILPPEWTVL